MRILSIDVGGTHVKSLLSDQDESKKKKAPSGPDMTPQQMVDKILDLNSGEKFDRVAIGIPAPIVDARPYRDPVNLGGGWTDFDFQKPFGCPVKILNDAAMQAVGSYEGQRMLFLGLGTGLGSTYIINYHVVPLELAHMPFKSSTYEHYVSEAFKEEKGKKKWRKEVAEVVEILTDALLPKYIVLGGGNANALDEMPPLCRLGDNANAFKGGFEIWNDDRWSSTVPTLGESV